MRQEVTDEFLYQYVPRAEEAWIGAIEKQVEAGHAYSRRFEKKMKRILLSAAFTICISVEATREQLIDFVEQMFQSGYNIFCSCRECLLPRSAEKKGRKGNTLPRGEKRS